MIYRENAGGGDQSSPTEYKRGDYRKMTDCQLTANEEGDHKNITEPYGGGGGIIRILQSLMGGIIRILQSLMGYQVNFIGHNQKPPTHPQAINCDRSLRDGN